MHLESTDTHKYKHVFVRVTGEGLSGKAAKFGVPSRMSKLRSPALHQRASWGIFLKDHERHYCAFKTWNLN